MNRNAVIATLVVVFSFGAQSHLWAGASSPPAAPRSTTPAAGKPRNIIWRDPGDVASLNLAWAEGGPEAAPKPPFVFLKEDKGGTNPKIEVRDANRVVWGVKWGEEVNSEVFASRLVWAVGYFVEPSYFVPSGRILHATTLSRANKYVNSDGSFSEARFEKKDKRIVKMSNEGSWSYEANPFAGTKELNGLKVMIMLLSNWDSKDVKQAGKGSNTKIFIVKTPGGTEHHYVVSDWGGTLGKWGNFFRRGKWDCEGYRSQNDDLVKGTNGTMVEWGYSGQHTSAIRDNIPIAHVRWLLGYLGKVSDSQLSDALQSSGATAGEQSCFLSAVRMRISALQALR